MVPKLSKILLVTDFSETAGRALPFAYAIADVGGEVHLLHVIEHQDVPSPLYAHYSIDDLFNPENQKKAMASVEAHLKTLVPKGAVDKHVTTSAAAVVYPSVPEGITAEAEKRGCDAIVIGSHGRTGLAHVLMGSVAEHVIRHSTVPVLVVPLRGH